MAENRTMATEAQVEGFFSAIQPEARVAERERCHAQCKSGIGRAFVARLHRRRA